MAHSGSVTARTYTPRHQLAGVTHDGNAVAAFAYDPGIRETSRTLGSGAGVLTRTSTYARQDNLVTGQQVGTMHGGNDRPGLRWDYTYDANKNLQSATTSGPMAGFSFTTAQDAEDRLTGWTRTNGETSTWSLSDVGDWDSYTGQTFQAGLVAFNQQRTHNAVHELLQIDEGGTLTPIEHDAKGNITQDQFGNVYTYDFDNQLTEAKDSGGAVLGTYTYDALGRRTERTVAATGVTTAYVCLTDASGMGQVIAEYENGTLARQTTYGSYVDEPMSVHVKSGTNAGNTYWYHADRQYNVLGLADAMGMVVERYSYTPYGARRVLAADGSTVLAASAFGNARGHQGLWHDDETGLVYNRARYRSVTLGRWMGRDATGYLDGPNLFAYLGAQPVRFSDPTGMWRVIGTFFVSVVPRGMNWGNARTRPSGGSTGSSGGGSGGGFNASSSFGFVSKPTLGHAGGDAGSAYGYNRGGGRGSSVIDPYWTREAVAKRQAEAERRKGRAPGTVVPGSSTPYGSPGAYNCLGFATECKPTWRQNDDGFQSDILAQSGCSKVGRYDTCGEKQAKTYSRESGDAFHVVQQNGDGTWDGKLDEGPMVEGSGTAEDQVETFYPGLKKTEGQYWCCPKPCP